MVLESVWLLPMEEKFLHVEELKEEVSCPYLLSHDINDRDSISIYIQYTYRCCFFKVTPFFMYLQLKNEDTFKI